ncbi:hypothetical protein Pan241w_29820 [Gimesia alba]|uniref:Zinc-finger domain-containing protein n=1 Tax=Gimesia alba TaxID=2527973 RepID=A0A517RG84_9PLAN|nr:hypothetical protein [Gimesia alba]QDT42887.1 hypothetical protein Pan241w_29820 [Gimesia alba]
MKNHSSNAAPDNDPVDLDWVAFQYLSNELSEQESEAFELLLSERQEAREALATATQLLAGLKTLGPVPTVSSPTTFTTQSAPHTRSTVFSRTQQWVLVSCAAILLLAATFLLNRPVAQDTTTTTLAQTEPSQEDLEHVLDLWSESAEDNSITVALSSSAEPIDFVDQPNALAENQSLDIPEWLYTAVSLPEESVN